MSKRLSLYLAVVTTLLVVLFLLGRKRAAGQEPYVPANDREVLEHVSPRDARRAELDAARALHRASPNDMSTAVQFARLAIVEARLRSDPRYLGYAQAALGRWWQEPAPPPPVRLLRATILQSLHDFDAALVDLDALTVLTPDDPQAWLTRASVLTVRARYDEARTSCNKIALGLPAAVCLAAIDGATGHAREGAARILAALGDGVDPAARIWALSTLGELAVRIGDNVGAEKYFREALSLDPSDPYVLGAYADLLIDAGRPGDAIILVQGSTHDDGLLLRLVLAGSSTHRPLLDARYAANRARGDVVHRREESRFALAIEKDTARALTLAVDNWAVQREPADARVLLEAAAAAKDPKAAESVLAWLRSSGIEDPTLRALASRVAP